MELKKKEKSYCKHCLAFDFNKGVCTKEYPLSVVSHRKTPKRKEDRYECEPKVKCLGPFYTLSAYRGAKCYRKEELLKQDQELLALVALTPEQQILFGKLKSAVEDCVNVGILLGYQPLDQVVFGLNGKEVTSKFFGDFASLGLRSFSLNHSVLEVSSKESNIPPTDFHGARYLYSSQNSINCSLLDASSHYIVKNEGSRQ